MFWRRNGKSPPAEPATVTDRPQAGADQDGASVGSAPDGLTTALDVASGYRLFLGREAENPDVVAERAGQSMPDMLHGFLGSDEFGDKIARAIAHPEDLDEAFRGPASADLREWVIGYFSPDDDQRRRIAASGTLLELQVEALALPGARGVLQNRYGTEDAAALVAELAGVAERQQTARGGRQASGTTAEDIYNLYILMHDRLPESAAVAVARPETPFLDTVMEFLTSREFALNITSATLNGRLGDARPLAPALRAWAVAAFGIELDPHANRQKTVVTILNQPDVADRLTAAELVWSASNIVRRLEIADDPAEPVSTDSPSTGSFFTLVEESGLFDPEWYMARNVDLRRTAGDPLTHFVNHGAAERRDPGPGFDTAYYTEKNPDIGSSGFFPFEHYLRVGRAAGVAATGPAAYERWAAQFDELTSEDLERIIADAAAFALPPLVCLQIVEEGAAHDSGRVRAALAAQVGVKPDVRVVPRDGSADPARALHDVPDGAVVVLVGGAALPRPHACFVLASVLARDGGRALYSDRDHVDARGRRIRPVFTPAMSPDFMRRQPYAGPFVAVRLDASSRPLVGEAVAAAIGGDASIAFAALLLAIEPAAVRRVPMPLFSLMGEHAEDPADPRPAVYEPVRVDAIEPEAAVLADPPQVCILIPTRDRWELLKDCIDSILAETDYPADRLRIIVIDNDSSEPDSLAYLDEVARHPRCSVVASPGPFNFAKICNDGAAATDAEMLLFLNNDMTVLARDWLVTLVANAMRPEIGIVGTQLLYPDDTVQHGGVILGLGGVAGHRLPGMPADEAALLDTTREMTAVTGACIAIRREVFAEVGGFDTVLSVAFNDVVLCLEVFRAGYRNLYIARPLLYHHESKSRGFDDTAEKVTRNAREAIYTLTRYAALFRDDPSYNPNLSLAKVGRLAAPPRLVRPWRRSPKQRHALILSVAHGIGHGVGCVVALQAEYLLRRGWAVTIGGAISDHDRSYPGCRRVKLAGPEEAAAYAVNQGVDCVIAHTPPFFSTARYLGDRPLAYFYDHGEPPPTLFADTKEREGVDWEKRFCAPLARRVLVISQAIRDQQYRSDTIILRNGNNHLAIWSPDWAARRAEIRKRLGFEGRFVVLNVCRFHKAERAYKGIDDYLALTAEAAYAAPEAAGRASFVLAGRGDAEDIAFVRKSGIKVYPNVSDVEMSELYAAADLYVNLSRWEGYNLGIGQALAMGLDVIASDIPAHREFGVPTADATPKLCRLLEEAFSRWDETGAARTARINGWDEPLARMTDLIEADLAEDAKGPWL